VGISSDKLCLRMARPLRETPSRVYVARMFVPDYDVDDSVRQVYPFVVLEYAISVYTRLGNYSDERSRSEQCRASLRYAPAC